MKKTESKLNDMRKAESTSLPSFNMLKPSYEDEMENDDKDMEEEKSLKAATVEQEATTESDPAETVKELARIMKECCATALQKQIAELEKL